jgi:hypothetical protein
MKNNNNLYLKLILIVNLISFINLNAQCQIEKNLDTFEYSENNVYYKDINNILNPFEGTFLNSNSGFVLRISLLKKLSSTQPNVSYCEDMLIGAFEFISGAIQLNTLSTLNTFYEDGTRYTIYANSIYTGKTRGCDECGDDEKWLIGTIKDPVSGSVDELFIRINQTITKKRFLFEADFLIKTILHHMPYFCRQFICFCVDFYKNPF